VNSKKVVTKTIERRKITYKLKETERMQILFNKDLKNSDDKNTNNKKSAKCLECEQRHGYNESEKEEE